MSKRSRVHLRVVIPAEDADKIAQPDSNPTMGLRAPCTFCKASIPIELIPLPPPKPPPDTYKLEDLTYRAKQLAKRHPTHTMRGWCSLCKVYGFDAQADLGRPMPSRSGVTVGP